jgi:hypothetical protein
MKGRNHEGNKWDIVHISKPFRDPGQQLRGAVVGWVDFLCLWPHSSASQKARIEIINMWSGDLRWARHWRSKWYDKAVCGSWLT